MLIGDDTKQSQIRQRSDSMILCSFNVKTNNLTLISFLRDTYIPHIPGFWADKLNAAYAYGGVQTMDETFSSYFGVQIDAHVAVQFEGFKGVIDMLGGVDISLTPAEVQHINSISPWNLSVGMNHLTGEQALVYARIRKIDMDAKRAQRQRNVIIALINAYKDKSLPEMLTLTTKILESGFIKTDMSPKEVLDYVSKLFPKLATTTISNLQIPADGTYTSMTVGNITATKVCDFEANRKLLEQVLQ
jgi:LCP family protein required for cell wall assembly